MEKVKRPSSQVPAVVRKKRERVWGVVGCGGECRPYQRQVSHLLVYRELGVNTSHCSQPHPMSTGHRRASEVVRSAFFSASTFKLGEEIRHREMWAQIQRCLHVSKDRSVKVIVIVKVPFQMYEQLSLYPAGTYRRAEGVLPCICTILMLL
jgi:hypothetical protein